MQEMHRCIIDPGIRVHGLQQCSTLKVSSQQLTLALEVCYTPGHYLIQQICVLSCLLEYFRNIQRCTS